MSVVTYFVETSQAYLNTAAETQFGAVAATVETMLLHVDLKTRRTSEAGGVVATNLAEMAKRHASLPNPDQLGRAIG